MNAKFFEENSNTKKIGDWGESLACAYLEKNRFFIIEKNYRIRGGEVDLIAKHKTQIHFIEVKFRRTQTYGTGLDAVDLYKQRRISRAAQFFILKHPNFAGFEKVFSVLNITESENKTHIDFFSDAFETSLESF